MADKTYNGWANYETWNVALWIDNEQGSYTQRCEMAQEAYDETEADDGYKGETREECARRKLADRLKDWIKEMNPIGDQASLFSDLLNAALGEVDWHEIAENFLEYVEKAEPEPDDEPENDDGGVEAVAKAEDL